MKYDQPVLVPITLRKVTPNGFAGKGEKVIFVVTKKFNMGLLTPKGKKGDKKASTTTQKSANAGSKFISKSTKAAGGMKKGMTGGSQRGS
ncbi:MAG TPA: hypothetical protein VM843_04410 [Flavisolibacter sp.]|nr:hypothetical protein [Flavisolibacter sp.]